MEGRGVARRRQTRRQKVSFATDLEKHVERLGISGALAAFAVAGDAIGRRTFEQWRAGRVPRVMVQRGALSILSAARATAKKRTSGKSNKQVSHGSAANNSKS